MAKLKCGFKNCDKDADVECNGLYFCMQHFHEWVASQTSAFLDWEVVND